MTIPRIRLAAATLALALAACAATRAQAPPLAQSAADNEVLLGHAEQALAQNKADEARAVVSSLALDRLDATQTVRCQLVEAEIALAQDQPVEALQKLPAQERIRDPKLAVRAIGDRASALFRMGDPVGATQAMLARERLLPDAAQRATNRDQLWAGLRSTDLDTATGPRMAQADKVARGWVELAVISRSVWLDPHDLETRLAQWRTDFPGHPAADRIPTLTLVAAPPPSTTREHIAHIALLLPLSGSLAASAEAVRDGFFAAFYESPEPTRPSVRLYDTGATADTLLAAHRAALDDGAEFIIGPLRREDVVTLAAQGRSAVPILALNYLDPGKTAPFNFFQWGLAPEDEARQAAERAIADGQARAVAMVPEGEWGDRVLRAFSERLTALGGKVVASSIYPVSERDHSDQIEQLFALDASEERHKVLTTVLGERTQFQPRRRDDIGLVFIAARPDQAKLLGPQLRFHRSGELPIYATAAIYDGDAPGGDLSGLRFCDMPWMLAQDAETVATRGRLQTLFPARAHADTRLMALGHDAYTLLRLIDGAQLKAGSFFPAASGTLSLREDNAIVRGLSCAEVRGGALRPLEAAAASH